MQATETMPAITIRNPWAWCIAEAPALTALGATPKLVENRGRRISPAHIGRDIAIHAGQAWDDEAADDPRVTAAWETFARAVHLIHPHPKLAAIGDQRVGIMGRLQPGLWTPAGAVTAVATLVDCHIGPGDTQQQCCPPWGERWHASAAAVSRAWHLVFANVRTLRRPVYVRGQQAVPWTLPPEVAAQVTAQLKETSPWTS